mmetsp:Transcript_58238/g.125948  ORF Transcript_58238/g.125948 Transcript_58238/m.125948 type:complete len:223 (-) Transcript_58238:2133-2801(-)
MLRDHDAMAHLVIRRSTCSPHHLHHIHWRELVPCTLLGIVDLSAFDDHSVRGKVHTPRQGRCGDKHLNVTVCIEIFNELPVCTRESRVVNGKAIRQEILHLLGLDGLHLSLQDLSGGRVLVQKFGERVVLHRQVTKGTCCLDSFLPRVHEDQDLILPCILHQLLVAHLIHRVETFDGLLVCDANIRLLEGTWAILVAEIKEPLVRVNPQKNSNILIIRQSGR